MSWTYEITTDDYTVNFFLQNYIHVTKNDENCQKFQCTTTAHISDRTFDSQLSPPGKYLDDLASTRSARASTTCPSRGPCVSSPDQSMINQSINNKFADGAMVRHSSDESEAPEMAGDYSKAIEKRCVLRWREKRGSDVAGRSACCDGRHG